MPYTKFVKRDGKVDVYKKGGKAFTSHSPSLAKAHKTARLRQLAESGRLRAKAHTKGSLGK